MTLACTFTFAMPDDFDFTKHVNFAWFLSGLAECGASFYPNYWSLEIISFIRTGWFSIRRRGFLCFLI